MEVNLIIISILVLVIGAVSFHYYVAWQKRKADRLKVKLKIKEILENEALRLDEFSDEPIERVLERRNAIRKRKGGTL